MNNLRIRLATVIISFVCVLIPSLAFASFDTNLGYGNSGSDVLPLQQFLNSHGFTIAESGPGSPGNESDYFGSLTRAALAEFQAANGITPSAGYFGPLTRAKANALMGGSASVSSATPSDSNGGASASLDSLLAQIQQLQKQLTALIQANNGGQGTSVVGTSPQSCPSGYTGTYPNCSQPTTPIKASCPYETVSMICAIGYKFGPDIVDANGCRTPQCVPDGQSPLTQPTTNSSVSDVADTFTASPISGTVPLVVTFSGSVTASYFGGVWIEYGDGTKKEVLCNPGGGCSNKLMHTYAEAGTYTAKMIGVGEGTSKTLKTINITVGTGTAPTDSSFSATPTYGPAPLTVRFTGIGGGTSIDLGDGVKSSWVDGTPPYVEYTYQTAGTYTATLRGLKGILGTATITVN